MAFTQNDSQVQDLMKAQPKWGAQQAVDWANRYYTPSEPAAPASIPGTQTQATAAPVGPQTTGDTLKNTATVGATPAQGSESTVAGAFQQALVNRLAPAPVSAQSAEIQPAIEANKLAEQRGAERQRSILAERSAAQGTNNSGGFDSRLLGIEQDRAAREGQFTGNAVQQLGNRQAQEGLATQGLVGSMLSGNDQLNQQKVLADLDAAIRREGLGVQSSLGQGDLALRDKLGTGNLNLGLLGLLSNNQQFGQQLSSNNALATAGMNQQALMQMLGML